MTKFEGPGSCVGSKFEPSSKASSIWFAVEAAGLGLLTSEIDAATAGLDCSYLVTQRRDCA